MPLFTMRSTALRASMPLTILPTPRRPVLARKPPSPKLPIPHFSDYFHPRPPFWRRSSLSRSRQFLVTRAPANPSPADEHGVSTLPRQFSLGAQRTDSPPSCRHIWAERPP